MKTVVTLLFFPSRTARWGIPCASDGEGDAETQWSSTGPGCQWGWPSLSCVPGEELQAEGLASKDRMGVGIYLGKEKQIKNKTRINRVQGSGLWASAFLAAPRPVALARVLRQPRNPRGAGCEVTQAWQGRMYPPIPAGLATTFFQGITSLSLHPRAQADTCPPSTSLACSPLCCLAPPWPPPLQCRQAAASSSLDHPS